MSLNWTQISISELKPIPLPDEKFMYTIELADITVVVPPTLHGPKTTLKASGTVWLSNQRVVFLSPTAALPPPAPASADSTTSPTASASPAPIPLPAVLQSSYSYLSSLLPSTTTPSTALHSLSVPLRSLHSQKFNQPLFSPPSVSVHFAPTAEGGFAEGAREIELDVCVKEGKAWEFSEVLEKARERAGRKPRRAEEGEGLPAYPGRM